MKIPSTIILCIFLICLVSLARVSHQATSNDTPYRLGLAITDITGPAAEVNMMGYAMLNQRTHGIHLRLRSRVFMVEHKETKKRVVYVNNDICMCMQSVKETLVEKLHAMGKTEYTRDNLIIGATHTHSGPGGFSWYNLYDITSLGFQKDNFDVIVNGILKGILKAEENLRDGRLRVNAGRLDDSNINRSPTAYLENPKAERDMYASEGDTDKFMTVLRFEGAQGEELGVLSWFPVHCTSMNNTNQFISSDNKGYASYIFEKYKNPDALPGQNQFVAAFGQANEGDVSPNTRGPKCPNGKSCDLLHSTCEGNVKLCIASGPGRDMFESTKIIGTNQFKKALELYNSATTEISGPLDYRHTHVDMTSVKVSPDYTSTHQEEETCKAAVGFSFAAGTTDGPGENFWIQGDNSTGNAFWKFVSSFIAKPTPEQVHCQRPKPILIDVGLTKPSPWTPPVLPIQLTTLGKELIILSVPAEFSTMSGRRLKKQIKETLIKSGKATNETHVVISGLANGYSGYVTTYEEYIQQRYEGASTLFGPHTLSAYIQEMDKLAKDMGEDKPSPPGPTPKNLKDHTWDFRPGVVTDSHPFGKKFGSVRTDANEMYETGQRVKVEFWGAHPNNNLMTDKSFLNVEQKQADGSWKVLLTDGDWDTKMQWQRHLIAESIITTTWDISREIPSGTYRIHHYGTSKDIFGDKTPYEGVSREFKVVQSQ